MSRCSARCRGSCFASILAFWVGELVNSYVLARMKIWTKGRHLWSRTIGSTMAGQGVDSLIFYPVAFYGVWETGDLVTVFFTQWALKVGWEAVLTPVNLCGGRLAEAARRRRRLRFEGTDFTPFRAKL